MEFQDFVLDRHIPLDVDSLVCNLPERVHAQWLRFCRLPLANDMISW